MKKRLIKKLAKQCLDGKTRLDAKPHTKPSGDVAAAVRKALHR